MFSVRTRRGLSEDADGDGRFTPLSPLCRCVHFKRARAEVSPAVKMVSDHPSEASACSFEDALSLLQRRSESRPLSTGSHELDSLIGGLEPGLFYLFYGSGEGFPDRLLHRLLVEAVRPGPRGRGRAIYVVCGNYRRSRTVLDSELLLALLEEEGLDVADALSRIQVVCAFSEAQQAEAAGLVEGLLGRLEGVSLVAVQQIAKLFSGPRLSRHGGFTEFVGMVSRLRTLCYGRGIALAATCRPSGAGRPAPLPEGGVFLRHAANVVVYLRAPRGRGPLSAYLIKHPDRARMGRVVEFGGEGGFGLGRVTKESMRRRLQGLIVQLRGRYRAALKDDSMQRAFDRLWAAWSSEQGAMIHSEVLSALDLLLLTAVVDNRKEIEELRGLTLETRRLLKEMLEASEDES